MPSASGISQYQTCGSSGLIDTRILFRSNVGSVMLSITCRKTERRLSNVEACSRFRRRGRMRPKPEASRQNFAFTCVVTPVSESTVSSAPDSSLLNAVTLSPNETFAPFLMAPLIMQSSNLSRRTWKVVPGPGEDLFGK
jgi:hypothetical protein